MKFIGEWKQQYQSYNHNIKLFLITTICTQIGMGIFSIVYNFYIRELGYSEQVNGNIISMTALASAIILIPAGILSDRLGRKRVMGFGLFITAITLLLRSVFEIESFLVITAFMTGLFMAFLQVSSVPWLAENSTTKQRIHLFSFQSAMMMIANVIGNIAGGALSDSLMYIFDFTPLMSIRLTLIVGALIFFAGFIPILKMREIQQQKVEKAEKTNIKNMWSNNRSQFKIIALFAVAQLLIGFGSGLVIPYLNLYFADRFQANHSVTGLILSLGQAATAIAMFIGPAVVKRVGEVRAVVYLQLLSLPFLLLTAFTNNLIIAAIGFLFRQALMNAGNPIQATLVMARVDNRMRGLANSTNQMVFSLGWAFMGPVSTTIVMANGSYWGYAYVFSITATLYLIGSLYFFFVFKSSKPVEEPNNLSPNS